MASAQGTWAAYDEKDHTSVANFSSEIAAFRFGNPRHWQVIPWPFGLTLAEAIARATTEAELEQRAVQKRATLVKAEKPAQEVKS